MPRGRLSNNSESDGATPDFKAALWIAADKLRNNMNGNKDRKKHIKLLGLNLGIAAADIITISSGVIGPSAMGTAIGVTVLIFSVVGVIGGNYKIFTEREKVIPRSEYYIDDLKKRHGLITFEEAISLAIDQILRLQKKNKNIQEILPQIFVNSKITCDKFNAAVADSDNAFFMNIRKIINKLNTFDEEDYIITRKKYEAEAIPEQIWKDKLEVYNEYINSVKAAIEDNEQIMLMLDKLLLGISNLDYSESGQRDQITDLINELLKQLEYYKKRGEED